MTRSFTITGFALSIVVALVAQADAQQNRMLIGNPQPAIQPPLPSPVVLPKFGFQSYNIHGYGEQITFVRCHSIASQLGLEPGDMVLSLNGFPLTYHGAWNQALSNAVMQGGSVQLAIRDVRSGAVVYRSTFVGGTPGYGPITPKVVHHGTPGPITIKSTPRNNFNNNLSGQSKLKVNPQTIQQLGQLFKFGE